MMASKMLNKKVLKQYIEDIDSVLVVHTMMNRSLFMNYCIMYTIHMCEKDAYNITDRGVEYSIWVQRNRDDVNEVNGNDNTVEYSLFVKDSINNIPIEIYSA